MLLKIKTRAITNFWYNELLIKMIVEFFTDQGSWQWVNVKEECARVVNLIWKILQQKFTQLMKVTTIRHHQQPYCPEKRMV